MGLHLNYELRLPVSATEEVETVLVGLRDFALALPFKSVTEILPDTWTAGPIDANRAEPC